MQIRSRCVRVYPGRQDNLHVSNQAPVSTWRAAFSTPVAAPRELSARRGGSSDPRQRRAPPCGQRPMPWIVPPADEGSPGSRWRRVDPGSRTRLSKAAAASCSEILGTNPCSLMKLSSSPRSTGASSPSASATSAPAVTRACNMSSSRSRRPAGSSAIVIAWGRVLAMVLLFARRRRRSGLRAKERGSAGQEVSEA